MFRAILAVSCLLAWLGQTASAQIVVSPSPVITTYYAPTISAAPRVSYYAPSVSPPVTAYYAPAATTSYYAPSVVYPRSSYYTYYAPRTSYYSPTTSYYSPTTSYYAPTTTSYYAPATVYYGSTDYLGATGGAYVPAQPVRNALRLITP